MLHGQIPYCTHTKIHLSSISHLWRLLRGGVEYFTFRVRVSLYHKITNHYHRYTHTHTQTHTHIHTFIHIQTYAHTHMHTHTRTHTHLAHTCTQTHTRLPQNHIDPCTRIFRLTHTHKAGDIDIETLISLRRERGLVGAAKDCEI